MGMKGANLGDLKMMLANATMEGSVTTVLTPPNTTPFPSQMAACHAPRPAHLSARQAGSPDREHALPPLKGGMMRAGWVCVGRGGGGGHLGGRKGRGGTPGRHLGGVALIALFFFL